MKLSFESLEKLDQGRDKTETVKIKFQTKGEDVKTDYLDITMKYTKENGDYAWKISAIDEKQR